MVLRQALYQSIREEGWIHMHDKLKEVSTKIGVKKAFPKVAGLGKRARQVLRSMGLEGT